MSEAKNVDFNVTISVETFGERVLLSKVFYVVGDICVYYD